MKQRICKAIIFSFYTSIVFFSIANSAYSEIRESETLTRSERLNLARSFVKKIKSGLSYADTNLLRPYEDDDPNAGNILQDGELLLLQPVLRDRFHPEGLILAEYQNGEILVSLRDFSETLRIAITVDPDTQTASGFYIDENKPFFLDVNTLQARTDQGEFTASPETFARDGDIFVALSDLEKWIDMEFSPIISTQRLTIESEEPLPIEKYYARRKLKFQKYKMPEPELPRLEGDEYKAIEMPAIDVATTSTYRKRGGAQEGTSRHNATIRTTGDLAYGTLTTQSRLNNEDQLTNISANYKQESAQPDLLGPLKARRFELGDVISANFDLGGSVSQAFGARITNTDPLRSFSSPTTNISGQAFPGWDVELYRNDGLIDFQEVDENGYYNFENVDLFNSDNNFKLIFFGPQGERREENLYIPIDRSRLANRGGIYDVSVTLDEKQTFKRSRLDSEDEGSVNVTALYERPILGSSAVTASFRSNEHEGERNYVSGLGLSTTVAQTLLNIDAAVDDEGETAARLVARKNIGKHDFIDTVDWIAPNFDTENEGDTNDVGTIKNTFRATGPMPFMIGKNPRYNVTTSYSHNTEGRDAIQTSASLNTNIKRVSLNEQLSYQSNNFSDDRLNSISNMTATYGRNRFRVLADYEIKPDSTLSRLFASYRRDFNRDLDLTLEAERQYNQKINEFTAKLDWQAGFVRLSPQITYNTNKDFFARLNTRFGILKEPHRDKFEFFDRNVSNNGALSAFVYLDADGDGQYSEGEEKLKGIIIKSVQNGGRATTDENGIALFNRLQELRLTDVKLDSTSLQDPTWVSGFEGVSILPRKGHVATIEFPVHISGDIDGTIFARSNNPDVGSVPLRNITLNLYNDDGEIEQSAISDSGGFYYFSTVPPGRYLLLISEKSAKNAKIISPPPQAIEIGYDGTVIYGNDIIVEEGEQNIPSEVKANLDDYKARHPHINFDENDYEIVLNLGEYNSRLMMSLVHYKVKTRYLPILSGGSLIVPPNESYADEQTGKHSLRFGLRDVSVDEAYNRCKSLVARSITCKVEIFPSYIKQAKNEQTDLSQATGAP